MFSYSQPAPPHPPRQPWSLPAFTCYSLLVTRYLLLVTCYLLLRPTPPPGRCSSPEKRTARTRRRRTCRGRTHRAAPTLRDQRGRVSRETRPRATPRARRAPGDRSNRYFSLPDSRRQFYTSRSRHQPSAASADSKTGKPCRPASAWYRGTCSRKNSAAS